VTAIRRGFNLARDLWLMLGVLLILLGLVELLARALHLGQPKSVYNDTALREQAEPGAAWAHDYYQELDHAWDVAWADYTMFTIKPWNGKYFHIDAEGRRRTINLPPTGADLDVRVFGGSAAWGWSNREEHTIPSVLASALRARGVNAQVENDARPAWQSTQETIALLRQLGSGRRVPEVVVFLDGANDIQIAFEQGLAGTTEISGRLERDFYLRRQPTALLDRLLRFSALRQALVRRSTPQAPELTPAETEQLAVEVTQRYRANVLAIEGMAKTFGFRAIFFWQPLSAFKKSWSSFEEATKAFGMRTTNAPEIYVKTTAKVREALAGDASFHDLSALFADSTETIYTDLVHYTEPAAAQIAERMSEAIATAVANRK
jgi:hypothetical protein